MEHFHKLNTYLIVSKQKISMLCFCCFQSNADASISRHVISSDQYHVITTLIQYYQMEIRWSIRQLLLQAFGVLCSLDKTVVSIMLNSVLPGELARDMVANPRNIPKLNYSSLLLTMIFSMGEPMPVTHLGVLAKDTNFVPWLVMRCFRLLRHSFLGVSIGQHRISTRYRRGRTDSWFVLEFNMFLQFTIRLRSWKCCAVGVRKKGCR